MAAFYTTATTQTTITRALVPEEHGSRYHVYDVRLHTDGTTTCTCRLAAQGRKCPHIAAARAAWPPTER